MIKVYCREISLLYAVSFIQYIIISFFHSKLPIAFRYIDHYLCSIEVDCEDGDFKTSKITPHTTATH